MYLFVKKMNFLLILSFTCNKQIFIIYAFFFYLFFILKINNTFRRI